VGFWQATIACQNPFFSMTNLFDLVSQFTSVFLGIFIEAVPFLLLGTLASGLVEVFFNREELARVLPRQPLLAALTGSMLGLFLPVCECGVVPLTRRLFHKGVPSAVGISFLLAAPVINPVVLASTYAAFGLSPLFWGRIALTLGVAVITGLVFALQPDVNQILRDPLPLNPVETPIIVSSTNTVTKVPLGQRLRQMVVIAGDEFFEMGRYLVIGSMMAALLQTFVPQQLLASLGRGPVLSVVVMAAIAVLLSVCSTVDAFIALAFIGQIPTGALLSFLVYGPMVDIKSTIMFTRVFRRRGVIYLVFLPLLLTLVSTALWNML
jgi:uncharacterized membrane protein YraQ (UPF0718 family)